MSNTKRCDSSSLSTYSSVGAFTFNQLLHDQLTFKCTFTCRYTCGHFLITVNTQSPHSFVHSLNEHTSCGITFFFWKLPKNAEDQLLSVFCTAVVQGTMGPGTSTNRSPPLRANNKQSVSCPQKINNVLHRIAFSLLHLEAYGSISVC